MEVKLISLNKDKLSEKVEEIRGEVLNNAYLIMSNETMKYLEKHDNGNIVYTCDYTCTEDVYKYMGNRIIFDDDMAFGVVDVR